MFLLRGECCVLSDSHATVTNMLGRHDVGSANSELVMLSLASVITLGIAASSADAAIDLAGL
ncbi:hypothetical protein [Novipirellula galeiformis]|uniref:hypothetical protein n=1 Tax=Novipirellula galeiformis TaxID=2528004 RepID=UPI0011B49F00|nr:hypothetical protein [Novipirellula galeiformis]